MGTHSIEQVQAVRDAIDRLQWRVRVATDFYGSRPEQIFALHWDGVAAFYLEAVPSSTMPGQGFPRLTLPTRWVNRNRSSRIHAPGDVYFEFATDIPCEALDRIEKFRSSARLYARLEGALTVVYRSQQSGPNGWSEGIAALMGDFQRVPSAEIRTEPLELTRDLWCREVLAALRPPGRHIIEVAIPQPPAQNKAGENALRHLDEAQRAFDEGRFAEVARVAYRALDELPPLVERVGTQYGMFGRDRIKDEIKALRSLCNSERHGEQPQSDGPTFDRVLALHVLVGTKNLVGFILGV